MSGDVDAAADTTGHGITTAFVEREKYDALVAEVEQLRERADAKERGMNAALSERDTYKREAGQLRADWQRHENEAVEAMNRADELRAERDAALHRAEIAEIALEDLRVENQQLEEDVRGYRSELGRRIERCNSLLAREQRLQEALRQKELLVVAHHAVGALDNALVGDQCPICAADCDAAGVAEEQQP